MKKSEVLEVIEELYREVKLVKALDESGERNIRRAGLLEYGKQGQLK